MKKRTKPADIRIDELMNAAQALFLKKGVDATTVNDIISEVQVAKGTFYHYFTSKQEIVHALRNRYTEFFLAELKSALETCAEEDWAGQLSVWIRANIQVYIDTFQIHDVVYGGHHHHERHNQERNAILDQLTQILIGGGKSGIWAFDNLRVTTLLIYSGVHGATDEVIVSPETNIADFSNQVVDAYLRMLKLA